MFGTFSFRFHVELRTCQKKRRGEHYLGNCCSFANAINRPSFPREFNFQITVIYANQAVGEIQKQSFCVLI